MGEENIANEQIHSDSTEVCEKGKSVEYAQSSPLLPLEQLSSFDTHFGK